MSEHPNPDGWHRHVSNTLLRKPGYAFCPICGCIPTEMLGRKPLKGASDECLRRFDALGPAPKKSVRIVTDEMVAANPDGWHRHVSNVLLGRSGYQYCEVCGCVPTDMLGFRRAP